MNAVVQHAQKPQAKSEPAPLAIGPAHDRFEAEADRIAHQVAHTPQVAAPPPNISPVTSAGIARMPNGRAPEEPEDPLVAALAQRSMGTSNRPPEEPEPSIEGELTQRAPTGHAAPTAPAGLSQSVRQMRASGGSPLHGATRTTMEQGLGRDLSGVRLHTSPKAATAARAINARAFTVGRDVFFGQGAYQPQSSRGQHLLAHELVHTVQQSGGSAQAQRIQRTPTANNQSQTGGDAQDPPPENPDLFEHAKGKLQLADKVITVPKLELPELVGALKGTSGGQNSPAALGGNLPEAGGEFRLPKVSARDPTSRAAETWTAYARENWATQIQTALQEHLDTFDNAADMQKNGEKMYFLRRGSGATASSLLIGTAEEIAQSDLALRPQWSQGGGEASLDADHILEWQLGGADSAANMWLLKSSYNQSVGNAIKNRVRSSITDVLEAAHRDTRVKEDSRLPAKSAAGVTFVRQNWTTVFETVSTGRGFPRAPRNQYWTKDKIQSAEHLKLTRPLTDEDLQNIGLSFADGEMPTKFLVFPNDAGGKFASFPISRDGAARRPSFFFPGLVIVGDPVYTPPGSTDDTAHGLSITFKRQKKSGDDLLRSDNEETMQVNALPHLGAGGIVDRTRLLRLFHGADFTKLSPLTFTEMGLDANGVLVGTGYITATKLLFPNLQIPIHIHGTDLFISFPVPAENLGFGPVAVTEAALNLGVGDDGFFAEGLVGLSVASLGTGTVSARVARNDVILSGEFDLEMDFLDDASVSISYSFANNTISGTADASVQTDRLPGVTGGSIHVEFSNDSIGVQGTINLAAPLEGGTLTVGYLPETGLTIGAENIPLPADRLPGISSAMVSLTATRSPDTGAWNVAGTGSADIETTGVTGDISVTYNNGAFLISGNGTVSIGEATGNIALTVTNMPIDEEGNPVEGEIADTFSIWGRGSVTITFGEILTGTAGIEYTPDGRVIISGEIALPESFEVFERQRWEREVLSLETPDFPIWGVSIAGIGFGIFASADGYVNLEAWLGPGTIENARIGAEMDLEHPEDLSVNGTASFVVPAYGGLNLGLGGNIYARAAVAYARGRVGITGSLGLEIGGGIDIGVNWDRQNGLSLDASAHVEANPKFRIGLEASISAGVDLGIKEVDRELGHWDTTLGEFGPDMTLGVRMPARWSEANGLEMSLDDIEVTRPTINARDLLDSAFDSVV